MVSWFLFPHGKTRLYTIDFDVMERLYDVSSPELPTRILCYYYPPQYVGLYNANASFSCPRQSLKILPVLEARELMINTLHVTIVHPLPFCGWVEDVVYIVFDRIMKIFIWFKQCSRVVLGLSLGLGTADESRRYKVTPSLIGWAQT